MMSNVSLALICGDLPPLFQKLIFVCIIKEKLSKWEREREKRKNHIAHNVYFQKTNPLRCEISFFVPKMISCGGCVLLLLFLPSSLPDAISSADENSIFENFPPHSLTDFSIPLLFNNFFPNVGTACSACYSKLVFQFPSNEYKKTHI